MAPSVYANAEPTRKSARRVQRALWSVVVLLALIGSAVVILRAINLVPILLNGYHPPAVAPNAPAAQFAALDDLFARYPALTFIHIIPGLLFMVLGPLQFNPPCAASPMASLEWARVSDR